MTLAIPNASGILVALVTASAEPPNTTDTAFAIHAALVSAGISDPGVQVDGSPGGNPAALSAPVGQAYCWILLDDAASLAQQNLAQTVLSTFAANAKAPTPGSASSSKLTSSRRPSSKKKPPKKRSKRGNTR